MNRNHTSRTAILVFAHSSHEEAKHKPIAEADALFDVMTERTLEIVEKTGLPYYHFSETVQVGTTFGERFANAIKAVYDKGYEHVITIGNDCPQLRPRHILKAESQLKNNVFVLGPAMDGGFYLMGLHRNQFNTKVFQQLSWQTSKISRQLIDLVSISVDVFQLQTLFDIDTMADIRSLVAYAYHIPGKILQILLHILVKPGETVTNTTPFVQNLHFKALHNKGSPVVSPSA